MELTMNERQILLDQIKAQQELIQSQRVQIETLEEMVATYQKMEQTVLALTGVKDQRIQDVLEMTRTRSLN